MTTARPSRHALTSIFLAIAVALLLAPTTSSAGTTPPAPPQTPAAWSPTKDLDGAAGTHCDTETAAREAVARLGETHTTVVALPQAQLDLVSPGTAGYPQTFSDGSARIVLTANTRTLPCVYVWAVTAHELAHVWQYRATDNADLYTVFGRERTEIVADCVAVLTGWHDYRPYLTERATDGGPADCTAAELAEAKQLQGWAR